VKSCREALGSSCPQLEERADKESYDGRKLYLSSGIWGRTYIGGRARQAPVEGLLSTLGTSASISGKHLFSLEKERSITRGARRVLMEVSYTLLRPGLGTPYTIISNPYWDTPKRYQCRTEPPLDDHIPRKLGKEAVGREARTQS